MITVYGINNCITVQKARAWLDENSIIYNFHDYKKLGIDVEHLEAWCSKLGWQQVLNTQGMMWRKSSEDEKRKVVDQKSAIEFMLKVPTSIKRPIIEYQNKLLRGFNLQEYKEVFVK